jgi:hypothetical protein
VLNGTIDRLASESISPHVDWKIVFRAKISIANKDAQGYTTAVAVGRAAAPGGFEHIA